MQICKRNPPFTTLPHVITVPVCGLSGTIPPSHPGRHVPRVPRALPTLCDAPCAYTLGWCVMMRLVYVDTLPTPFLDLLEVLGRVLDPPYVLQSLMDIPCTPTGCFPPSVRSSSVRVGCARISVTPCPCHITPFQVGLLSRNPTSPSLPFKLESYPGILLAHVA